MDEEHEAYAEPRGTVEETDVCTTQHIRDIVICVSNHTHLAQANACECVYVTQAQKLAIVLFPVCERVSPCGDRSLRHSCRASVEQRRCRRERETLTGENVSVTRRTNIRRW